jgi:hypothetical protein
MSTASNTPPPAPSSRNKQRRGSKTNVTSPPHMNIWHSFLQCAENHPNTIALSEWRLTTTARQKSMHHAPSASSSLEKQHYAIQNITWTEYVDRAKSAAQSFLSVNISLNDAVLFLTSSNSLGSCVLNMGAIGAGACVCHWRLQIQEIRYIWNEGSLPHEDDSWPVSFKCIVTDAVELIPTLLTFARLESIIIVSDEVPSDEERIYIYI